MAKLKIQVNDANVIRDLLQEAYNLADEQLAVAHMEITKMANAVQLQETIMDEKSKYGKIISDYLAVRDKAMAKKIEIAKLLTEIYKHNGDVNNTLNDSQSMKGVSFDFSKIRDIVNEANKTSKGDKKEIIELKK